MKTQRIYLSPGDVIAVAGAIGPHVVYTGKIDGAGLDVIHNEKGIGVQRGYLRDLLVNKI